MKPTSVLFAWIDHQGNIEWPIEKVIANNQFEASWSDTEINFRLKFKKELLECKEIFENWLSKNGFDVMKVRVLTALIYLNIAALHHYPYSILLYGLGKQMLHEEYL